MKTTISFLAAGLVLAFLLPASAAEKSRGRETVNDLLNYWIEYAEDEGYEVIYSTTGTLTGSENAYHNLNLLAGRYHVYAQTTREDDDIDLNVYDSSGELLGSDTLSDNYPIVDFRLRRAEQIQIEVLPYEYDRGNSARYAIVVATENGGLMTPGTTPPPGRNTGPVTDQADLNYINGVKAEYMETIIRQGYELIFDNIEVVEEGNPYTFPITLGRGDYMIIAEGGLRIEDLDIAVYDDDWDLVAEDTSVGNTASVEISTRSSRSFTVEITAYDMASRFDEGYFLVVVVQE